MHSNLAAVQKSSEKEQANGKTFRIPISTGIFEHCPDMLDSFWLFIWYIDKTTKENDDGEGFVLGGMPIVDSRPADALRVPVKTIRRWRKRLVARGYIQVCRTPYGCSVTLLKSKKWKWGPTLASRDLPKREISATKENARIGHSDLPNGEQRVPVSGRESARNGKYKEDKAVDLTGQNSRRNTSSNKTAASPLRSKPSGKGQSQIGFAQTPVEIAVHLARVSSTAAEELARLAKSNFYVSGEEAKKRCGAEVDSLTLAFAAIGYPFDLSSPTLGWEFCQNVKQIADASRHELPRPRKWELCERVLEACDKTWDDAQVYSDVGPAYWPPDFDDHINSLFERQEGGRIGVPKTQPTFAPPFSR